MPGTLRPLLAATLLAGIGLALFLWLVPAAPMTGDGQLYVQFVETNFQEHASVQHARRLLGPLVVRALPLAPLDGFHVLTVASLLATALLTWAAARVVSGREHDALLAIGLLFGTWVVVPNLREYALVDAFTWAWVAGAWLALLHRQWLLAAALAAGGALARELGALVALGAGAAAFSPERPARGMVWAAVVAAPAFLVAFGLMWLLPGGESATIYVGRWVEKGLGLLGPFRVVYLVFAAFGALWLLVPRGLQRLGTVPHGRRAAIVLLCLTPLLPLVGTPERMVALVFPAVLTCAVAAMGGWAWWRQWTLTLGNVLFVARVGGAEIPAVLAWVGLAVAVVVALSAYVPARWLTRVPPDQSPATPVDRARATALVMKPLPGGDGELAQR